MQLVCIFDSMQYGLCHLSITPLRATPNDSSEQTSQLLYGEFFKVVKRNRNWSLIRSTLDNYEGWLNNKQYQLIEQSPLWVKGVVLGLIIKLNSLDSQIQSSEDPKQQNKLLSQQNKILSYISGLGISFSSNNKQLQTLLKRVNRGK